MNTISKSQQRSYQIAFTILTIIGGLCSIIGALSVYQDIIEKKRNVDGSRGFRHPYRNFHDAGQPVNHLDYLNIADRKIS